ncbi:beta-lactamase family protein [Mucilaginibacter sp.]|uniref:beta-lactamase family protein n=1 Tax=Mucilaginibacter sp. TaxID=1882438 RepID=UPI0025F8AD34|nr:beta-lactamase family protein [Mucilaginibacter sp.]
MKRYYYMMVLLFCCVCASAQSKADRIDTLMQAYHRFNMFDGSILVAENNQVIYKKGFGLANREWNIPNTTDTKFMLGSISKSLTAYLVLIQVQKGLIDLNKTISDYIPSYSEKNGRRITIRQLLSHTSGIAGYEAIPDFFPRVTRQYYNREDYIKLYMDSTLLFTPGTNYNYSSWGYYTLGYILERVSGKSYAQLMKEDIFDKLGMNSSGSYYHTQVVSKRATGYDYSLGGYTSSDFRDQSNTLGTGDIYSTVEDMFKWHVAISDNRLLNKQLTKQAFTPGIRPWRYGFGWFNQNFKYTDKDSVFTNYHLGMTEGFLSFIVRVPETNSFIIFLCNSAPTDFFGITKSLLKILYNKPVAIKQPVHKVVEQVISKYGVVAAIKQYDILKKDTAHFFVEWWNMDRVGHQLLDLKRYDEALLIFKKNAEEFPGHDIIFDSLGRAYEEMGRRDEAIATYKKAISINAKDEEARGRLKKLESK